MLSEKKFSPRSRCYLQAVGPAAPGWRSEEHTSELQSRQYLVCRLLLEKKKKSSSHHAQRRRRLRQRLHIEYTTHTDLTHIVAPDMLANQHEDDGSEPAQRSDNYHCSSP